MQNICNESLLIERIQFVFKPIFILEDVVCGALEFHFSVFSIYVL